MKKNSLLIRQIRKHLNEELKNNADVKIFVEAVQGSYTNYEEQLSMLQRAMSLSSHELFDANKKLKLEAEEQRKVIVSLTDATKALRKITYKKENKENGEGKELSGIELANLIEKQAFQISEIERQRNVILKDLEKRNKELQNYTQAISHDLKSPLRNINTLISWVKEENSALDEGTIRNLDLIDKNIEKMDAVINGILEYSLIDKKETLSKPINTNDIIRDVLEELNPPQNIAFVVQENLPILQRDRFRIQKLFQKLLSNAIKSIIKKEGTITIGAKEQKHHWCFHVADNGKGISKKYHEKIFQIFQTLDDTKESTGMGLTIVKKIIELYEGEIWVESEEGEGSTFYFTIKK